MDREESASGPQGGGGNGDLGEHDDEARSQRRVHHVQADKVWSCGPSERAAAAAADPSREHEAMCFSTSSSFWFDHSSTSLELDSLNLTHRYL